MFKGKRLRKDYPKGVIGIYDNGGRSIDRITVVYEAFEHDGKKYWPYTAMGLSPFYPQGFCQHGETEGVRPGVGGNGFGNACGKVINYADLNADCQKVIGRDLEG